MRLAREQPDIGGLDLIGRVTCKKPYNVKGREDGDNIVVMDFGVKRNIIKGGYQRTLKTIGNLFHTIVTSYNS